MKCKTCKHWTPYCGEQYGDCHSLKFVDTSSYESGPTPTDGLAFHDLNGRGAAFTTGPDFGCVHHEPTFVPQMTETQREVFSESDGFTIVTGGRYHGKTEASVHAMMAIAVKSGSESVLGFIPTQDFAEQLRRFGYTFTCVDNVFTGSVQNQPWKIIYTFHDPKK